MTWAVLLLALAAEPAGAEPSAEQLAWFESRVRPLLVEHCHKCHGDKHQWASLRLDSREAVLRGGDSGPAVVPGQPEESLLIRAVRHTDENLKMPQEGRLSDQQVADLVRWVEMGVPFPQAEKADSRLRDPKHWAFQPLSTACPQVADAAWLESPIDRFILSRLEAEGLRPAPPADKRTLIRRVTFDLTGLPPTPEELDAFLSDEREGAWARLVDRLLASPAYGERWGRHWLDVARYADSNGLDENVAHGQAWRYRDYVVASWNVDKPLRQFVLEQLAGDLLPTEKQAERHERLIATGFLSIGPKVLAEVDQAKMQMDIVDEQIDTFGRVFLGMTLGCARCHDHKFDPIDTAEYYGLAGVFKSTRTMETYTKVARWNENLLPSPEATAIKSDYEARLAAKKQAVQEFVEKANQAVRESHTGDAALPDDLSALYTEETKTQLKALRDELAALEKAPPDLPAAMGVGEDAIVDVAVHIRGNPLKLGAVAPRQVPRVLAGATPPVFTASSSGRKELAEWLVGSQSGLTARVFVNRVWRWHFGEGLVRTPDNFGQLGETPSHPELLDFLAARLIADDWSIKRLHRLILLSATYQQSSRPAQQTLERDPDNRLFSRAAVRRLEAEAVRDSLLAVSGRLDRTFGGSLLKVPNRGYFFDHTSIDTTDYSSRRRSLYLPVVRNNVYDMLQLLDFADPAVATGDRATTTVAPQSLMMLNSNLVMEAAEGLARSLLAMNASDPQRIAHLTEIALGRRAADDEIDSHLKFVALMEQSKEITPGDQDRRLAAWSALCHVVLASNEFVYLQ